MPCITKAQQILSEQPETEIVFFTTKSVLDKTIIEQYPVIKKSIFLPIHAFPHKKLWHYPSFLWHLIRSFFISLFFLYRYKPTQIISMGGLISLPVCLAGKALALPITLYELNVVPGKAIQALAPLADSLFICFQKTQDYFKTACTLTQYPLRFTQCNKAITKENACKKLGFQTNLPIILILGGSQGSLFLNNTLKAWLQTAPNNLPIQIIHQIGNHDTQEWHNFYDTIKIPALVFSFHHELEDYYAAADIVLCRAGAGTLFEILFFQKSTIVIPLETKTNTHQLYNAVSCAQEHPTLITVLRQHDIQQNAMLFSSTISQKLNMHSHYNNHYKVEKKHNCHSEATKLP